MRMPPMFCRSQYRSDRGDQAASDSSAHRATPWPHGARTRPESSLLQRRRDRRPCRRFVAAEMSPCFVSVGVAPAKRPRRWAGVWTCG
ncbi:hypothetical protein [Lysobacter gummosus]|uniref:hypothetical protein n=1 Tax=Lysobacter gummosus TaxID=262324 RepID=UPI003635A5A7